MFKKICSFIILIIMTISLVSVFVYPVYRIKSEEILTEGSFIETLNECGYLENNDYEISNDIYLADLIKMFVSYVKYDYDIYKTLESKTFVGKMNELFTVWINPLSLFLILLVYLILIITLFVIFMIFTMWDENVLRLCSILCSSPISTNTLSNTAISDDSRHGINNPE